MSFFMSMGGGFGEGWHHTETFSGHPDVKCPQCGTVVTGFSLNGGEDHATLGCGHQVPYEDARDFAQQAATLPPRQLDVEFASVLRDFQPCRVYWGSHGCMLPRGHDPIEMPHRCECCDCPEDLEDIEHGEDGCVGRPPYYGPDKTHFFGEDAVPA